MGKLQNVIVKLYKVDGIEQGDNNYRQIYWKEGNIKNEDGIVVKIQNGKKDRYQFSMSFILSQSLIFKPK